MHTLMRSPMRGAGSGADRWAESGSTSRPDHIVAPRPDRRPDHIAAPRVDRPGLRPAPPAQHRLWVRLRPLLAAEAAAEEVPGTIEAADLEQAVWLRLLELRRPPAEPSRWVRATVRAEVRAALRDDAGRMPYDVCDLEPVGGPPARGARAIEDLVIDAEQRRRVRSAVGRLPGRCPQVVMALMSRSDHTYREISRELGISQGSLGPLRSRCLSCLRTILVSRVAAPVPRGKAR